MEDNPSELAASNEQNQNQNNGQYVSCNICQGTFKTDRGLLHHLSFCRKRNREYNVNSDTVINDNSNQRIMTIVTARTTRKRGSQNLLLERSRWNSIEKDLADTYEKIVWKRNLFTMPSSETGEKYIEEITRLLKLWIQDSPLKAIAFKAIHVMPTLLLQKHTENSKSKKQLVSLERRLKLWLEEDISNLLD